MFKKLKKGLLAGTIFSTAANMHACVYGPPPSSLNPSSDITTYDDSSSKNAPEDTFEPSDNQNEDVYGPPEYFDPSLSEDEPEVDEPDDFDPSMNEIPSVYGPPEMLLGDQSSDDES